MADSTNKVSTGIASMTVKVDSEMEGRTSGTDRKHWSPNPFCRKTLRQMLLDMTVHAVEHIADRERVSWSRLLWMLAFSSSLGVFLMMFYRLQSDYYMYPHKTVVESTPSTTLPFPAVSVCNINTLDVSNVSYAQPLRDIMSWMAFGENYQFNNLTDEHRQVYNMSAQTILEETDPGIDHTVAVCFYDGTRRDCRQVFMVTHWGLTRCYTLDTKQLHAASASTTFRVIMNINQAGYVVSSEKSAGVKFFIHEAEVIPNFDHQTSTASPGFATHVGITYEKLVLLEQPFKSFGDRYCIKTANINSPGGEYHLMNCLKERALQMAHEQCQCITPFHANTTWAPCSLFQMLRCVMPILEVTKENIYNASDILGCPLPCEFSNYVPSITFSYYPSHSAEALMKSMGILHGDVRANYLELNFYYTELILHKTTHVPEYTSMSIMGSIGGNMGFFLGASVLSFGEIAELLFILVVRLVRRLSTPFTSPRGAPINVRNQEHL